MRVKWQIWRVFDLLIFRSICKGTGESAAVEVCIARFVFCKLWCNDGNSLSSSLLLLLFLIALFWSRVTCWSARWMVVFSQKIAALFISFLSHHLYGDVPLRQFNVYTLYRAWYNILPWITRIHISVNLFGCHVVAFLEINFCGKQLACTHVAR